MQNLVLTNEFLIKDFGECFGILDFLNIEYDGLSWEAFSNSKTWVVKLNLTQFKFALERI